MNIIQRISWFRCISIHLCILHVFDFTVSIPYFPIGIITSSTLSSTYDIQYVNRTIQLPVEIKKNMYANERN